MGYYLLVGATLMALFMAGPPLIMGYAAYKERREKAAQKETL